MASQTEREDILTELFNISVGKSASILSEIINKKIVLNVPRLEIVDTSAADPDHSGYVPAVAQGTMMVSSIKFREDLRGKASLLFPADKMREFINLCSDEQEDEADSGLDFTDIDFDIVKEIGNIILNSLIGGIANFLKIKLDYTLSEVQVFNREQFEDSIRSEQYVQTLVLYITFKINDSEIAGAVIINLALNSLSQLLDKVDKVEEDFCG